MIKCINSNIEIYSENSYNVNNWSLVNNNGTFNILNNSVNTVNFCILQNGNVGIGSTSPKSLLDIVGAVNILGITSVSSNFIITNVNKITPIAQIGTNTNAQSNIYFTGGSNARIGIGSSSPTASIDIAGTANVSGLITANGGIMVPVGTTLNTIGNINANTVNATTVNTATINADVLNVTELLYAVGGILVPQGSAILAQGGIFTSSLNATQLINANRGITVSAGSFLTANGGIVATTISTSGLINANGGITVPVDKSIIANGGILATTVETSGTITAKSTTLTTPLVQFGTNTIATNNIYFVGGGRARIGIGSSIPTVSLDIVGDATISGAILTNTIGVNSSISANTGIYSSTIIAGGLITANGGITVPTGKQIIANGGIEATTIKASGLITANNGISATSIDTFGFVNANGGLTTATIVASGLIKADAGLNASTITSAGIVNANGGLSVTTINATAAITGTTIEASSTIKTVGGLITTTIDASQLITANNGLTASSINAKGIILADRATATIPVAQFGNNTNVASNLYFIGGGTARIGIGSSAPNVPLDIVGGANISGVISANGGISATTISASGLLSANNGISATTINALNSITVSSLSATTPITQIGTNTNTASNLYFIGGGTPRIGIGSSSPGYSLDIIGDTNITGAYRKNNRDVINDTSNYILSTSNIIVNRLGDYLPYTWIINSQSFNLNYTLGNVGIGTTEPQKKLHVMHPSGELIRIETNANGINQVSGIEFGIPSYNSATRSKITSTTYDATVYGGIANDASDLQFSTTSSANNSSVKMSITPTGNVGIGITNPPNILQIGNAGRLRVANNISDYTIIGTANADDTTNTKIEISGNTRNGASQGGNISYVATNTNGYHQFMTNSTEERMRIISSGNVGIGTTNPEQLLTLLGNNSKIKIKNSLNEPVSNKSVSINLENGVGSEWIISNSNNLLSFDYNNNIKTSNRLIIDGVSGNIGIGTSPHIYKQNDISNYILNIVGNVKVAGDIIPSSSNVYNLGSTSNKWKDLYLSGNSIYLDDLIISRDSNVNLNIKDLLGNYKSINLSNIQLNNINNSNNSLTIGIDINGNIVFNSSNKTYYPVTTTNIENTELLDNVNKTIFDTSNYAIETSNILSDRIATLDNNASNYVLSTSNIISKRITDLTTDMINENLDGAKKFIINHRYNNDLLIDGDLTVNNNLIVLGDSTTLETIVYTTERLEVINANNKSITLMIQQKDVFMDIFVASNLTTNVFNIANNGDVDIKGIYKKDNRDVFFDTSNYVLTASNNLINKANENDSNSSNYIATTSNILYNNIAFVDCKLKLLTLKVNLNDIISSNYVFETSNILAAKATLNDNNSSNYILTASNNLINKVKENDNNSSNYILTASNNLINKVKENDENSSNYILTASNNLINKVKENDENSSNYILTASNNLINKVKENDENSSNYILTASNNLINKIKENDENSSNYILTASNNLINKIKENDENSSNYILTASNNLINKIKENDNNSSNYILTASNNLINKVKENDENSSNYILTASNNLINKIKENDNNSSNYILTASNNLINKIKDNDENSSNYILTASNNLINKVKENDNNSSNYILTASNNLINKAKLNDENASNYILTASNNLINKAKLNDENASNFILSTSNFLSDRLYTLDQLTSNIVNNSIATLNITVSDNNTNTSNYILSASNIISKRITDLTTDMITENINAANKFIVNNSYNNNLFVNGDLTINSNLIVLGDSTILETTVYTTERLEVINANNTTTALMVQQKGNATDIFVASNLTTNVFNIANNGDVNITGIYRKNNRDVFYDTCNFILSTSNFLSDRLYTLDQLTSNIVNNSIATLNITVSDNNTNTSNFILSTSNFLSDRLYTLDQLTSNIVNNSIATLNITVSDNNTNTSNFILSTSNFLSDRLYTLDQLTSNIVNNSIATLNITVSDNNTNTSNFILSTSNFLSDRLYTLDQLTSNIVNNSIATLNITVSDNNTNTSNFILSTSNFLSDRLYTLDQLTSNIVNNSIATLNITVSDNNTNTSNYILSTSNIISKRITDLTTDMITENIGAANKFIVNNSYNNNLFVNGDLTINSNLIVLGDSTILETTVYTTERLEVINANNTTTALMVQQKGNATDIFVASNLTTNVFNIANNGDVNITGIYRKNNRDVLFDTSNYVLSTSNILSNRLYILDQLTSNIVNNSISTLNIKVNANDVNTSNYVLSTSNILAERINKYSVWIPTTSNIYYYSTGNVGIGTIVPESKLHVYDNSSSNTKLTIHNNFGFNSIQPDIIIAGTTLTTIGTDKCITFPYSGSSTTKTYTFTTSTDLLCDILVIGGGGGGGGSYVGGGGGGGGYVYLQNVTLPSGNHTVNVGSGGSATSSLLGWWGGNGANSSITGMVNYIAQGGGGGSGGSAYTSVSGIGNNGGSGGGGSYKGPSKTISAGGISTQFSTYGYGSGGNGGSYDSPFLYGGGGGGAGGSVVGGDYNGANGLSNSITGSLITYAGGGGAGSDLEPVPQGGTGGGGPGANGYGTLAIAGTNGLGGGGGGARGRGTGPSASGGSGIVIIRYRSSSSSSQTSSLSSATLEFIRGTSIDGNTDYKIGNYNGDFKIISSVSSVNTDRLLLTSNGNITLSGSLNATSYLLNGNPFSIATEVGYTSNYISTVNTSLINQINELNNAQLNYVLSASSNLGDGLTTVIYNMNINDRNISNYVLTTSNVIETRINELTTDKIVEGSKNKFIIENKYNSNLEIKGNLVINSNLIVNNLATLNNNLNITGDVNFTGDLYKNGMIYPNGKTYTGSSSILSQYSPIQTQFSMYKNVVEKSGSGWQFIDNNINVIDDKVQGFCVRIKPNHYSSKILINLNCHIGIDYGTDARWWGLRLYRKIGEAGEWTHISNADGTDYNNNNGTTCWLSHNLGADASTQSYFIANVSGAYYDIPGISEDYIYYTAKWCSLLGDSTQNGKLYLNRPAIINALNAPIVSSSWNVSEIWQLETSYFPKGGIVTKYTPTQTQFNIYKNVVEKLNGGWQFIDNNTSIVNNNIQGFCVRIKPNHYTSKILINLTCHIGIDYGTDARWWGLRLYRRIGETGAWTHITDANGNNYDNGTPCWLSHNLGAETSTYSYFIANVSGAYYDMPNAMDTYVYYTAQWCSQLGDAAQNGKLYLNRPATYNSSNSAVLSSSWNAQEIWQLETTFIPKNAVICQNMSIQTLFNIYRNIVIKTGYGWQFIDNNTNIINEKIQGFCVRIKPTHPSSKVLVHISCHIGIDYGTDARWWGLRLYRKIGEGGEWTHISDADGNNLIDNQGTSCWLSHNLGAESSTSSYFVANISGSFFDLPGTSSDFVYYTAKWCSILGDNSLEGKIYLNRPASYNNSNSAVLSSSWNAQEIWQLGTPYEPAEYSIINIFNNNNVGIGNTNPICKLDVNGTINAINYSTISDRRFKKDIQPINSSLELINRINPVSYLTIEQNEGDRKNYGFIAQDLHNIIPEAVNVPANKSHKYTIEYMSIIPLLTKSIQELSEKINNQQKTIDDLNDRLNNMNK